MHSRIDLFYCRGRPPVSLDKQMEGMVLKLQVKINQPLSVVNQLVSLFSYCNPFNYPVVLLDLALSGFGLQGNVSMFKPPTQRISFRSLAS